MYVYTSVLCVSFPPSSSIVLSVCLDLHRSCVISTSELSVKFSYACKKEQKLIDPSLKQHQLFFFFTGSCQEFSAPTSFIGEVPNFHFDVNTQIS